MSVEKANEMGRLLIKIKDQVGHGNFGKWVEDNLPFSWFSAAKYMTIHRMYIREEGFLELDKSHKNKFLDWLEKTLEDLSEREAA